MRRYSICSILVVTLVVGFCLNIEFNENKSFTFDLKDEKLLEGLLQAGDKISIFDRCDNRVPVVQIAVIQTVEEYDARTVYTIRVTPNQYLKLRYLQLRGQVSVKLPESNM